MSTVVIATKKSGALRICIDPRPLNQALKRDTHQLLILDDLIPELARAKNFSTIDLTAGYWHCVLDNESSLLTTNPLQKILVEKTPVWSISIK